MPDSVLQGRDVVVLHLLPLPDGDGGPALHDPALLHIDVASVADTAVVQFGQQRKDSSSYLTSLCAAKSHLEGVHLNDPDHWMEILQVKSPGLQVSRSLTVVYLLRGEGKMTDVDEKVDDVVLADLPVLILLPLLVVVHHPLQHQPSRPVLTKRLVN